MEDLQIAGGVNNYHNSRFQIKGRYVGGIRGQSDVTWSRAMKTSPDAFEIIGGHTDTAYQGSADDVDCLLMVRFCVPIPFVDRAHCSSGDLRPCSQRWSSG